MEIKGKFLRLGSLTEGTSARGAWRKQELIIETIEQYPKQVCLLCWGDTIDALATLNEGDVIKASISIESREFNGKWYTDVRAFNVSLASAPATAQAEQPAPQPTIQEQPQPSFGQQGDFFDNNEGDLPF